MSRPISIDPDNPKVFLFRGKPRVLLTATEHYGAVMNRPFDFGRYLAQAAEEGMTLTRLFTLFRELQSAHNPYSTCKPDSTDYVAPFERTGPGNALDGLPRHDLDTPSPEYFGRLERFIARASDAGIIVEVVLLSNTYGPEVWALNPLHHLNNVNDLEETRWPDYMSQRHPRLFERQVAHVRAIVDATKHFDNVIYEVCNEPGGGFPGEGHPGPSEVNEWVEALAAVAGKADNRPPGNHLFAGQEAFDYEPFTQLSDKSFDAMSMDVVNIHPLPNTVYDGRTYDMGAFMSKQLCLRALRDYCLATHHERKPLNMDEDNVASRFRDPDGWTIHRKRAWTTLMCGCHYDYIDFSILPHLETGTAESRRHIRTWFGHLSRFIHSIDLAVARPAPEVVAHRPPHTLECALAAPGEDYRVYLADERELEVPGAGAPLHGELVMRLPKGEYRAALLSPETGLYSPEIVVSGGPETRLELPSFSHDIAVRLVRTG